jgi:hypothetical protein
MLKQAVGREWTGKLSPVFYLVAIVVALRSPRIADLVFASANLVVSGPTHRKTSCHTTELSLHKKTLDGGFMDQCATSIRNHCLSPVRASVAIDAPLSPATYARMFPDLPSFEADEQFLHALGRGSIDITPSAHARVVQEIG